MGSRKLPGNSRETAEVRAMRQPRAIVGIPITALLLFYLFRPKVRRYFA